MKSLYLHSALLKVVTAALFTTFSATAAGPWQTLVDGKSLAGWVNGSAPDGKPGPGWTVGEGMLHLKGKGGNLVSEKEYSSFELEWEWRIAEGANNGVKYWVTQVGPKREWLGIEYQMIDDVRNSDALIGGSHTTACIYDIKAAKADKPVKPAGEWNTSRVVVSDGKIQHWLNGKLVVEADTKAAEWKALVGQSKFKEKEGFAPGKGKIMLTDHQDETWFRNMKIREL